MNTSKSLSLKTVVERISSLEERKRDVEYISQRYPNHCPIFVRYGAKSDKVWRHIMPKNKQFAMLIFAIRKARKVPATIGLSFLVETPKGSYMQPPGNMEFDQVQVEFGHPDGFIYVNVVEQNVFG